MNSAAYQRNVRVGWASNALSQERAARLRSLERLQLAFCRSLAALPDDIGDLQQLGVLDIRLAYNVLSIRKL